MGGAWGESSAGRLEMQGVLFNLTAWGKKGLAGGGYFVIGSTLCEVVKGNLKRRASGWNVQVTR